ncbi:exodeoxyribonuclease VII small subunit [Candidatus Saccharibacteria bacterium]|nr:exodeoxyribonuclease VII small subunit [Candidatus Saccharibacteria bacterium]
MAKETKRDYQAMDAELAEIIDWFESDKVNLDEAIVKYEKALALIAEIEKYLKTAENKIKKITTKYK